MHAYREVRDVVSDTLVIAVPAELRHHRVEVILIPAEGSGSDPWLGPGWRPGFLERIAGAVPDFPDIESEGDFEVRERLP